MLLIIPICNVIPNTLSSATAIGPKKTGNRLDVRGSATAVAPPYWARWSMEPNRRPHEFRRHISFPRRSEGWLEVTWVSRAQGGPITLCCCQEDVTSLPSIISHTIVDTRRKENANYYRCRDLWGGSKRVHFHGYLCVRVMVVPGHCPLIGLIFESPSHVEGSSLARLSS